MYSVFCFRTFLLPCVGCLSYISLYNSNALPRFLVFHFLIFHFLSMNFLNFFLKKIFLPPNLFKFILDFVYFVIFFTKILRLLPENVNLDREIRIIYEYCISHFLLIVYKFILLWILLESIHLHQFINYLGQKQWNVSESLVKHSGS